MAVKEFTLDTEQEFWGFAFDANREKINVSLVGINGADEIKFVMDEFKTDPTKKFQYEFDTPVMLPKGDYTFVVDGGDNIILDLYGSDL